MTKPEAMTAAQLTECRKLASAEMQSAIALIDQQAAELAELKSRESDYLQTIEADKTELAAARLEIARLVVRCDQMDDHNADIEQALESQTDELAALRERYKWRGIETAPKDGTRIFVWYPYTDKRDGDGEVCVVRWTRYTWGDGKSDWTLETNFRQSNGFEPPTDWQPLPEPPSQSQEMENE